MSSHEVRPALRSRAYRGVTESKGVTELTPPDDISFCRSANLPFLPISEFTLRITCTARNLRSCVPSLPPNENPSAGRDALLDEPVVVSSHIN